jgi:hypothetical protein
MTSKKVPLNSLTKPDKYVRFVSGLKLMGIGLDSASVSVDRANLVHRTAGKPSATLNFDGEFATIEIGDDVLRTEGKFSLRSVEEGTEKELVKISCAFSAMFKSDVKPTTELADRFANSESKLVFWPYLRHFVADTSYRMAITPILLPLTSEFETTAPHESVPAKVAKKKASETD